jgi:hypothetical protein
MKCTFLLLRLRGAAESLAEMHLHAFAVRAANPGMGSYDPLR